MHPNGTVQQAGYLWVNMLTSVILRKNNQLITFKDIFTTNQKLDDLGTLR